MNTFSVVIPVYRATTSLSSLVEQLIDLYPQMLAEVILVFDCGKKESWHVISGLARKHSIVTGIRLSRNYGQHNATICGFSFVNSEFTLTMDEDLQHPPFAIAKLLQHQSETDADLVYGEYEVRNHSVFRNLMSITLNQFLKIGIPELNSNYSSFRLIRTVIAKKTIGMNNSYTFLDGYLSWLTSNVSSVKVSHQQSHSGESSYSTKKLIKHFVNIFVTFSSLPIKLLTIISFLFLTVSLFHSFYIIAKAIFVKGYYITGFPTIATMLGFGFGAILFGLGVLGEYIQRINLKTTNRPSFNIIEKIG